MKWFWMVLGILVLAGAAYLAVTPAHPPGPPSFTLDTTADLPFGPFAEDADDPQPASGVVDVAAMTGAAAPVDVDASMAQLVDDLVTSAAQRTETPPVAPAPDVPEPPVLAPDLPAQAIEDLPGAGTREDPYRITWAMLVETERTYRPRDGETVIPPLIEQLNHRYVEVTGYIAFPLVLGDVRELLVMLNQWDGCCIGIPPSVYDSVEVRLSEPIPVRQQHLSPVGTLTGRFSIDPYFVRDWLVGLYLMEDASIEFGM